MSLGFVSRSAEDKASAFDWEPGFSPSFEGLFLLSEIGGGNSFRRNVFRGPRGAGLVLIVLAVTHRKAGARKLLLHIERSVWILDMSCLVLRFQVYKRILQLYHKAVRNNGKLWLMSERGVDVPSSRRTIASLPRG